MRRTHLLFIAAALWVSMPCNGAGSDPALEALREAAKKEIAVEEPVESEEGAFTSGALSLQTLNPEISVTGDFLFSREDSTTDFLFRALGIHLESYLDPFTKLKSAVEIHTDEAELGEAYMTRFGILPHVNVTLGKFRQQFGVVNRWHKHGLDQVDFPLALRMIFGEGGLNQTGASIEWTLPAAGNCSQEMTVQITDGQNPRVFAENAENELSALAHYKMFRDLTASTYAEVGLSGLYGRNNEWPVLDAVEDESLGARVLGVDFSVVWEPTHRMRYRNVTWRTEAYVLDKDILAPDGSGEDTLRAWGAYSYLESKVSRTLFLGVRGDYFEPDSKAYADSGNVFLAPVAVTENDPYRWQVSPYVTWHQSEFVHFRAEFDHADGIGTGDEEDALWLQCIFAAGPHKHERY